MSPSGSLWLSLFLVVHTRQYCFFLKFQPRYLFYLASQDRDSRLQIWRTCPSFFVLASTSANTTSIVLTRRSLIQWRPLWIDSQCMGTGLGPEGCTDAIEEVLDEVFILNTSWSLLDFRSCYFLIVSLWCAPRVVSWPPQR